jgi:hypothetical protein
MPSTTGNRSADPAAPPSRGPDCDANSHNHKGMAGRKFPALPAACRPPPRFDAWQRMNSEW